MQSYNEQNKDLNLLVNNQEAPKLAPSLDDIMSYLRTRIAKDEKITKLVLLTCLSAYTDDPLNLFLKGPSSIGKSYIPIEVSKLFPEKDVWILGGLSPTALIHEKGILVDEYGNPIDFSEAPDEDAPREEKLEWKEKLQNAKVLVDLSHKILIFTEAPSEETFYKLRPILSHDRREIEFKFTEKGTTGRLKTTSVILRGFPATIFCSTSVKYIEEFATRFIVVTPEQNEEKYRLANELSAIEDEFPELLQEVPNSIISYFNDLRNMTNVRIVIPNARKLANLFPSKAPRDMRDWKMLKRIIKTSAILNFLGRKRVEIYNGGEKLKTFLLAQKEDVDLAIELFSEAYETTQTSLSSNVLDFYYNGCLNAISKEKPFFTIREALSKYREVTKKSLSYNAAKKYVETLTNVGYLDEDINPEDRRSRIFYCVKEKGSALESLKENSSIAFEEESFKEWLNILFQKAKERFGDSVKLSLVDCSSSKTLLSLP